MSQQHIVRAVAVEVTEAESCRLIHRSGGLRMGGTRKSVMPNQAIVNGGGDAGDVQDGAGNRGQRHSGVVVGLGVSADAANRKQCAPAESGRPHVGRTSELRTDGTTVHMVLWNSVWPFGWHRFGVR